MARKFPDIGHFDLRSMQFDAGTFEIELHDHDTRRTIVVGVPNPNGMLPSDDDPEGYIPLKKAADFLDHHMDDLPAEAVAVKLDAGGNMLSVSTDSSHRDDGPRADTFLLKDYQLPPDVAARTILRSELTEIRHLHGQVDLVSYPVGSITHEDKRYAFKYSIGRALPLWKEVQMLARLPRDPQLAWLDRVVLDETSQSRVVGFTMRFVDNASLLTQNTHFKLKWLRQLIRVVDTLNLEHGVMHQDIAARNLIVDPATDSIVLIDFNWASRIGIKGPTRQEGEEGPLPNRDDVHDVMVFLYSLITRDRASREYRPDSTDEKIIKNPAKWVQHPDVELDDDVAEFYFELMAWVRKRRAGRQMAHHTEAPQCLDWPGAPFDANRMRYVTWDPSAGGPGPACLDWRRPPASKVDPTRRLLATGKYADEEKVPLEKAATDEESTDRSTAAPENDTAIVKSPGGNSRAKCPGTPNGDSGVQLSAQDSDSETSNKGIDCKPRARQATPSKRKPTGAGADAGPEKRKSSRRSSPALSAKS